MVAYPTTSGEEWFDSTLPLKVVILKSIIANKFRRMHLKGFINPGSNNLYIGVLLGNTLFGVLGFSNATYGEYDILMKADTTPGDFIKSTDLLLFVLRTTEVKNILEKKFNRTIDTIYTMAFSKHPVISRYRKHGKLIVKREKYINEKIATEVERRECYNKLKCKIRSGEIKKQVCAICGKQETEAHHSDYKKPFEITWLCVKHHNEADKKDETSYRKIGYELGYLFTAGSIISLKEAKAQFMQKVWKTK